MVLLVGVANATETIQKDHTYTTDKTVASDTNTISQANEETINNNINTIMDENPTKKIDTNKTSKIEKKTKTTNIKKDNTIEVNNYEQLLNAVNDAASDTTIRLLVGSYNKTTIKATITDETGKTLVKSTPIAIKANGITIQSGINSNNGTINITFTNTLKPGMYELLIISGETGLYKSGKVTTVLKV